MPALLMRISIAGMALRVSCTAFATEAHSVTSTTTERPDSAAAATRPAFSSISQITAVAPLAARRWAMAKPIPEAPPVTTAWRPLRSIWFIHRPPITLTERARLAHVLHDLPLDVAFGIFTLYFNRLHQYLNATCRDRSDPEPAEGTA